MIFEHLQLTDLSSCALVCKALNFAVKAHRIRELAFTGGIRYWFHYSTQTKLKYRANYGEAFILKRPPFNFDYLKRLKISRNSAIDLNVINRFTHLEELDIDLANYKYKNITLRLANLKVLYVFMRDWICHFLGLDTPRLAKVGTFSLKRLEFYYPQSIRCIHTLWHAGKLPEFPGLESLIFTDHYHKLDSLDPLNYQAFEEFPLDDLKKLKEIDFHYRDWHYRKKNMANFKRMITRVLALERPDLKVFWFNVQVSGGLLEEFERLMENVESRVVFKMVNYEQLKDRIDFHYYLSDFNWLMKRMERVGLNPKSEELLSKLLAKFSLRTIGIVDKVHWSVVGAAFLMELIARSPNLTALRFENSGLSQSFFDRMTEIVRLNAISLQRLRLTGSNGILNFEFVCRLCDLEFFQIDQQLSSKRISKLLQLPRLTEIEILSKGSVAQIIKRKSKVRYSLNEKPLNLEQLLKQFECPGDGLMVV